MSRAHVLSSIDIIKIVLSMKRGNVMWTYYAEYWRNALNFKGRSRRKALWYPILLNHVIFTAVINIFCATVLSFSEQSISIVNTLLALIFFVPDYAVPTRRLHDSGRTMLLPTLFGITLLYTQLLSYIAPTGTFAIIITFPISIFSLVVSILILIFSLLPGDKQVNDYGSNPRVHHIF